LISVVYTRPKGLKKLLLFVSSRFRLSNSFLAARSRAGLYCKERVTKLGLGSAWFRGLFF